MGLASAFEQMRRMIARKIWLGVILGVALAFLAGYALGRAFERDGDGEEKAAPPPPAGVEKDTEDSLRRGDKPPRQTRARAAPAPASPRSCRPFSREAFAIPAGEPLRISWPLDIARGVGGRMCLRARQGANELRGLGEGWALYGLRVGQGGVYRSFLKVRWLDDGVGNPDCNNSWFASMNGGRKVCAGDDNPGPVWHWVAGPGGFLRAGVHWYTVEIREDGTLLDRIAIVPGDVQFGPERLEELPLVSFSRLAGARPARCPHSPVREVELDALPTGSLVIGRGHKSELTVLASYQGEEGSFTGEIGVRSPTARGLRVSGETSILCSADEPYARAAVGFEFGPGAHRGGHTVTLSVVDASVSGKRECVFRKAFSFLKPAAWAFLGPFPDPSSGAAGSADWPTEEKLKALAKLADPALIFDEPGAPGAVDWRLIEDGSCYDELGAVDLFKVYGPTRNVYCYAVSWLYSATKFPHRQVLFQSDDTAALWIDGRLISHVPAKLAKQHSRLWSGVALRKGLSPVVVKIAQAEGYWGFRLDALDWHMQSPWSGRIRWVEPSRWPGEGEGGRNESGARAPRQPGLAE